MKFLHCSVRRVAVLAVFYLSCVVTLVACVPTGVLTDPSHLDIPMYFSCGALGQTCCRAPAASQNIPVFGPIVSCQQGLGCDITTNKCVSPCGGTGQACCDGPETRAIKWTADGKLYSPNSWNMKEMCGTGACEAQTHKCFTCGTQDGGACCPPDAAQATARCVGDFLECQFNPGGFAVSGTCRACGSQGKPPCRWGCDTGLDLFNGRCELCGGDRQLPCDSGCKPGLGMAQGLCRACGNVGQVPCDNGCSGGLKLKSGVCAVCGGQGQAPCDAGCGAGTRLINGVCAPCGANGQPPCSSGCNYPMKVAGGVCRVCGGNGQIACDTGCNSGLVLNGGTCAPPGSSPPETCAHNTESCVADFVAGTHCCQSGGPLLCVYGHCKVCVPHGNVCTLGGTQTCCSAKDGDVCKLDPATGNAICDIPD